MQVVTIVQLIYGIPSLSLMFFFFALPIFERKTLSNSLYRLLQIDLFVNITCYLNTWIALRLEKEEFGSNWLVFLEEKMPGLLTVTKFMCIAYFHLQNFTGLSLAVYRLTSVHYLNSDFYWKRFYPLVPLLGVSYTALVLAPWWATGDLVCRVSLHEGAFYKTINMRALLMLRSCDWMFAVFYLFLFMLFGVWTTTVVMDRWKKNNSKRYINFMRKMTRIVYCNSFLMSGNLLFLMVFGFLVLFSPFRQTAFMYESLVVTFTSDMFTLAMPYILILFDSNIRRKFGIEKSDNSNLYSAKTVSNVPQN